MVCGYSPSRRQKLWQRGSRVRFADVAICGQTFSFPSCTSIIQIGREHGYLVGDYWLTYNEGTLAFGTKGHENVNKIMRGGKFTSKQWDKTSDEHKNVLRAAVRFVDATGFRCRNSEFPVVSVALGVIGHPDAIGTIKQHIEIVDWTTGGINTGKKIQLGFYYLAYLEMFPKRSIHGARIVKLDKKTGGFEQVIIELPELQQLAKDFTALRERIGII